MAHVWFDKLKEVEKTGGKEAIKDMKKDIGGNSLIGEYIGSDEH